VSGRSSDSVAEVICDNIRCVLECTVYSRAPFSMRAECTTRKHLFRTGTLCALIACLQLQLTNATVEKSNASCSSTWRVPFLWSADKIKQDLPAKQLVTLGQRHDISLPFHDMITLPKSAESERISMNGQRNRRAAAQNWRMPKFALAFLDITSQAHRYMNTSRGSYKAEKAREGGK